MLNNHRHTGGGWDWPKLSYKDLRDIPVWDWWDYCIYNKNSLQVISSATDIIFNSFDSNVPWMLGSNTGILVPDSGIYQVNYCLKIDSYSSFTTWWIDFRRGVSWATTINAGFLEFFTRYFWNSSFNHFWSFLLNLSSNEFLKIRCSFSVATNILDAHLSLYKI